MKLLVLLFGLAVGFGGGVYWGVHHPMQASQLADEEEKKFLETQIRISEAVKQKLDQVAAKQSGGGSKFAGSGFVSGTAGGVSDQDIQSLQSQQDQQLQQLHQRLSQLNSK